MDFVRSSEQPQVGLGRAIRQIRDKQGATQEDVAHKADLTTGTLSLIERGQANPTWATVRAIAGALRVSMGELGKLAEKLEG